MEQIVFSGHTGDHPILITDEDGLRVLRFGTDARQSCMDLEAPELLQLAYTRSMMTALALRPESSRILVLGLGGGSIARYLLHHQRAADIDAVDLSAMVIHAAQTYFRLPESERLQITLADAAQFVKTCTAPTYDLVFIDLFGPSAMAGDLFTEEFYRNLRNCLLPGAVVACNLWSGNAEHFRQAKEAAAQAFVQGVLELPVKKRANVVLLCFHDLDPHKALRRARKNLPALSAQYHLDFSRYFRKLRRLNRRFPLTLLLP